MNKTLFVAAGVVLAGSVFAQTASFTPGRLVVAASVVPSFPHPANNAAETRLIEYTLTPASAPTSTLIFPSSGVGQSFTSRWDSTSNLNLQLNEGTLMLGGYNAAVGTASLTVNISSFINRTAAIVPISGAVSYVNLSDAYSGDNIRSVTRSGNDFWAGGTASNTNAPGVRYFTAGPLSTQISTTGNQTNIRVVSVFDNNLYYGTGSTTGTGSFGVHRYAGLPTSSALAVPIISIPGPNASPYDFVFTNASTCYVADDRSQANGGGLYKFTFDGSVWSQAALIQTGFTLGCRSVTFLGNDSNGFAQLAVVTADTQITSASGSTIVIPSQIWQVNDTPTPSASLLHTPPVGTQFRGLRFIPGAANVNLTGTLNLNDTSGTFAFNRSISYAVKQGTTTVSSGTLVRNTSSGSFSISVPASATGAATIEWDGSSFLLRKTAVTLTGSGVVVGSVSVQNGDVDNSGEVDAADIDQVIADFGATTNITSDVDVSGEVDAADIDIVIANFGGVND